MHTTGPCIKCVSAIMFSFCRCRRQDPTYLNPMNTSMEVSLNVFRAKTTYINESSPTSQIVIMLVDGRYNNLICQCNPHTHTHIRREREREGGGGGGANGQKKRRRQRHTGTHIQVGWHAHAYTHTHADT